MKKCGIVFLGLLLLSALFITIGGAAISSAGSDAFVLSRERVYGEAAAMEGIALRAENSLAGGHLELEAGTDIKTQSRWRMSLTDAAYVSVSSLLMPGGDRSSHAATLSFNNLRGPDGKKLEFGGEGQPVWLLPYGTDGDGSMGWYSRCWFTTGGYVYFYSWSADEEWLALDASALPGGSWGVFRLPFALLSDCGNGRWWMSGEIKAQLTSLEVENVLPLSTAEVEHLDVRPSEDGKHLLCLLYMRSGSLELRVMDAASGEVTDSRRLFDYAPAEERMSAVCHAGDGGAVFIVGNEALAGSFEGGVFTPELGMDVTPARLPYGEGSFNFWDALYTDGRLAVLSSQYDEAGGSGSLALDVYTGGELAYTEFFSDPMNLSGGSFYPTSYTLMKEGAA